MFAWEDMDWKEEEACNMFLEHQEPKQRAVTVEISLYNPVLLSWIKKFLYNEHEVFFFYKRKPVYFPQLSLILTTCGWNFFKKKKNQWSNMARPRSCLHISGAAVRKTKALNPELLE